MPSPLRIPLSVPVPLVRGDERANRLTCSGVPTMTLILTAAHSVRTGTR